MKAKDVMTPNVVTIAPEASILEALRLMLQHRISGLPVVDKNGTLAGIVTEGDFLRRGELGTQRHRARWLEFLIGPGRLATEYVRACGRKVDEIMTTDLHTVTEETPLEEIVQLMEKHRIKRLPVVRGRQIVGIVAGTRTKSGATNFMRLHMVGDRDTETRKSRLVVKKRTK